MTTKNGKPELLSRREAILRVSAMFGGVALVGQSAMLASCGGAGQEPDPQTKPAGDALFSDSDITLLDEIAETILPETDTPGAKAADVGAFMALMVTDSYYESEQTIFREGMATINAQANESFGTDFVAARPDQRLSLLEALDAEQLEYMEPIENDPDAPAHYFRMMKELALLGYFTSEIGYTKAMRYVESPGRFDPCVPYEEGEKLWADHA